MGCGGFNCSRNALIALNTMYILISLLLIILPAVAKTKAHVDSLSVIGGIIASGVFLLLVSVLGLIGAIRHHQVCLFFYMVILFIIFLFEFLFSILCLVVSDKQIETIVETSWTTGGEDVQNTIQSSLCCCGLNNDTCTNWPSDCATPSPSPTGSKPDNSCGPILMGYARHGLNYCGGLGLFFAFTELIGVILTYRYRHQKNPKANPNAFL